MRKKALALFLVAVLVCMTCPIDLSYATTTAPVSIAEGEPIQIDWTDNTGTIVCSEEAITTDYYIPSTFILWVEGSNAPTTADGVTCTYQYDSADNTNKAYLIDTSALTDASLATSTLTVVVDGTTYTVTLKAPYRNVSSGTKPSLVLSYLPIGQYATGAGWGSIYNGTAVKGVCGYTSTGISLGAFGGYVEYYFANGIIDDPKNPYGVDFVIYGNAFAGNPEAGAVQVSEDGKTWYELAGSKYYDGNFSFDSTKPNGTRYSAVYTGTVNNTSVKYEKGSDIQVTLNGYGPYTFTKNINWWPNNNIYPMGEDHDNDGNVQVDYSDDYLEFSGITAVVDSNDTLDYAYGYADVTPNGNPAVYGNAINPYTPYTNTKKGGDGFDLAWAVDIETGLPYDVTEKVFRYVRVYSAVLDNGQFGETSTEICGIFTTANSATSDYDVTSANVKIGSTSLTSFRGTSGVNYYTAGNVDVYTVPVSTPGEVSVSGVNNSTNVYIEGNKVSGSIMRVIVQDGYKAPNITIIKFT